MIGEWLVTHLYRQNGHWKSWHRPGWSWEWEFYLPGPDLLRAIHWGWNIWYPGGRAKYLFARPCLIRDKWGNCDKTQPRHTSHHIPHPVTLSGPVSRPGAEYPQNLTPNWSHISPGIIRPILGTSLKQQRVKFLGLTKWAASEDEEDVIMVRFLVSVTADSFNRISNK